MLQEQLSSFAKTHNMTGKGALCVALVVTRQAVNNGLPLSPEALLTENHGQVKLWQIRRQNILKEHGIERVLPKKAAAPAAAASAICSVTLSF